MISRSGMAAGACGKSGRKYVHAVLRLPDPGLERRRHASISENMRELQSKIRELAYRLREELDGRMGARKIPRALA